MKTIFPLSILCAVLILNCAASDWPGWRGELRDGHVPPNESVPEKLPATPHVVWHVPTADGFSSPVVASGKVVLTDFEADKSATPAAAPAGKKPPKAVPVGREIVRALNAATGDELWRVDLDSQHKDGFGTGPRCTPLIDGKLVFAQSTKGELKCLNLADGKTVWRKNYITDFGQKYTGEVGQTAGAARHGNNGSPLVDGEHLIALPGGAGAGVVCFNKKNGDIVWKSQDDMAGYGPPVKVELCGVPQYVVFTAIALIGLDPVDGKLLWRSPIKTSLGRHVTTPVNIGDTVIVSSHQAGIVGVKIAKEGSEFKAEQIWTNKESAINFASPVAANGHLFGVGNASKLVCIEPLKGEIAWDQTGYLNKDSTHAHASLLVLGKNILALTDMGELLLFPADPKAFHEISRVKVSGPTWCNPPYADGRLYVRDANELQCIDLLK